jgi:GNAT superfamily N-acetyltransferase
MPSSSITIRPFKVSRFSWKTYLSDPGFRGKSVGRALLARVARIVEEANGFGIMFNVLNWNNGAIEFYQKIGATFLDDWKTVCLQAKALHDLAGEV